MFLHYFGDVRRFFRRCMAIFMVGVYGLQLFAPVVVWAQGHDDLKIQTLTVSPGLGPRSFFVTYPAGKGQTQTKLLSEQTIRGLPEGAVVHQGDCAIGLRGEIKEFGSFSCAWPERSSNKSAILIQKTEDLILADQVPELAQKPQQRWIHKGAIGQKGPKNNLMLDTVAEVIWRNGIFASPRPDFTFINKAKLTLDSFFVHQVVTVINEGVLNLKGSLKAFQGNMRIINRAGGTVVLDDLTTHSSSQIQITNEGELYGSEKYSATIDLENRKTGRVRLEGGYHRFSRFLNEGTVDTAEGAWWMGRRKGTSDLVIALRDRVNLVKGDTKCKLADFYKSQGTLNVVGKLKYALSRLPQQLHVQGDFQYKSKTPEQPAQILRNFEKLQCTGTAQFDLGSELTLSGQWDFQHVGGLFLNTPSAFKLAGGARLSAPQLKILASQLQMGEGNDELAHLFATTGNLDITAQEGVIDAQYGCLYSAGDMRLMAEKGDILTGAYVSTPMAHSIGWVSDRGAYYGNSYTYHTPNKSWIVANKSLHLLTRSGLRHRGLIYVLKDFYLNAPKNLTSDFLLNEGGKIIIRSHAYCRTRNLHNISRTTVVRWGSGGHKYYLNHEEGNGVQSAAQLQVLGNLYIETQDFLNQNSLIKVGGGIFGFDGQKYRGKLENQLSTLLRRSWHKINGWENGPIVCFRTDNRLRGLLTVKDAFIPPTLETLYNEGTIEAGSIDIRAGALALVAPQKPQRQHQGLLPLHQRFQGNGLFGLDGLYQGEAVISERVPLPLREHRSYGPRLILNLGQDITNYRAYFSPAALDFTLMTQAVPYLPQAYRTLSPARLVQALHHNTVNFARTSKALNGGTPLPISTHYARQDIMLATPKSALAALKATEPLMIYVADSQTKSLVPLLVFPEILKKYGLLRSVNSLKLRLDSLSMRGGHLKSTRGDIDVQARTICTAPLIEETTVTHGDTTTVTRTPHVATSEAHGKLSLVTTEDQHHTGTGFLSETRDILLRAMRHMTLAPAMKEVITTRTTKEDNGWLGHESVTTHTYQATPERLTAKAPQGKATIEGWSTLNDQASVISAQKGINLVTDPKEGQVNFTTARSVFHETRVEESSDILWQSQTQEQTTSTTMVPGSYDPGQGKITITAPTRPDAIRYEHRTDSLLNDPLAVYLKTQKNVLWQALCDTHTHEEHTQEGLSPAGGALVALAVGTLTAGTGSTLMAPLLTGANLGTTATAALMASANAGFSSLAAQGAVSFINNQGDFTKTLQDLTSSSTLKSLAVSMITAGLAQGALDVAGFSTVEDLAQQGIEAGFTDHLSEQALNAGADAIVSGTIGGENFDKALKRALQSAGINTVSGFGAQNLGTVRKSGGLDYLTHKLAHGALAAGCWSFKGRDEAFAAGLGAMVAETVGEQIADSYDGPKEGTAWADFKKNGMALSKAAAIAVAGVCGQDVHAASSAAETAVKHNAFGVWIPPKGMYKAPQKRHESPPRIRDTAYAETAAFLKAELAKCPGAFQKMLQGENISENAARSVVEGLMKVMEGALKGLDTATFGGSTTGLNLLSKLGDAAKSESRQFLRSTGLSQRTAQNLVDHVSFIFSVFGTKGAGSAALGGAKAVAKGAVKAGKTAKKSLRSSAPVKQRVQSVPESEHLIKNRFLEKPKMIKHHIFNKFRGKSSKSQKYRDFFKQHGILVDKYSVEIPATFHVEKIHKAGNNWTTKWKEFIDKNPNATTKEVYQYAGTLMDEYGLKDIKIGPYK